MYKLLTFQSYGDITGSLVACENNKNIPFNIQRIYYIFDTKNDVIRGKHAHKNLEQVLICLNGACDILLDDGQQKEIIRLDNKSQGLYIRDLVWREMLNFSEGCVLLVLASDFYAEEDYIRDYDEFLQFIQRKK